MPTEAFRATATTNTDPAGAWEAMQQPEAWEGIAGVERVTGPEFHADGSLARFRFEAEVGGKSYPGVAEVAESAPARSMTLQLATSELAATVGLALQDVDGGTEITIELTIRTSTFMASLFFPLVADVIGRGLPTAAEDFARRIAG